MKTIKLLLAGAALTGGLVVGGAGLVASATAVGSCKPAQMAVTRGQSNGAAGTIYYPIVFTDTAGSCAIWGVPAIQPVSGPSHTKLGPPAANASMGMMPVRHVLTKGMSVSVGYGVVDTGNYPPATCKAKNASGVIVSLAPFVRPTYVRLPISVCTKRVSTKSRLLAPGRTGV
ncbi:MAG: hypothetical protein KGJ36_03775 [Acidobacteriota bacterium]|nr:hypothetical protein [Acidobacteriota bacterium]